MKKFKFRLERVLQYRATLRKEKEEELARCNFALRTAEDQLDAVERAFAESGIDENDVATMRDLQLHGEYRRGLKDTIDAQRLLVLEAVNAVEEATEAYIEKAVEEKALETVKDQRHEEFQEEVKRLEKKEVDELVVQRHRLNKGFAKEEEK